MTEPHRQVQFLTEGMREAMADFGSGQLPLDRLAWELKSRISALGSFADRQWVDELRSTWGQIEYVNAFAIDSGRTVLTAEEKQSVGEALDELHAMLVEY